MTFAKITTFMKILLPGMLVMAAGLTLSSARAEEFIARTAAIPESKAVFARVESRTVVPARARIGGTIREVRVSEGSQVREGEVVGVVVDDKLALELNAADARINQLRSQLDNARTELERAQMLYTRGAGTQIRVDQAKTQFDVIANQVVAAEADKSVITQREREGDVLAPATGRVLTVPVTLGSVVLPGETLARIASGQYYLRVSLPERHATEIVDGSTVLVGERGLSPANNDAGETVRQGRIVKVYPEIDNGRVIADVEVPDLGTYFVNERVLVSIPVGERAAIVVPRRAIFLRHGIDYVRIAAKDGTLDVAVVTGEVFANEGQDRIEILTGLQDGDRIQLP